MPLRSERSLATPLEPERERSGAARGTKCGEAELLPVIRGSLQASDGGRKSRPHTESDGSKSRSPPRRIRLDADLRRIVEPKSPTCRRRSPVGTRLGQLIENLLQGHDRLRIRKGCTGASRGRQDPLANTLSEQGIRSEYGSRLSRRNELGDHAISICDQDCLTRTYQANVLAELVLQCLDSDAAHLPNVATSSYLVNPLWESSLTASGS